MRISKDNPHGLTLLNANVLEFHALGPVDYQASGLLTYATNEEFVLRAARNPDVVGLVTHRELAIARRVKSPGLTWIIADDPRVAFFRFHNWLASETQFYTAHKSNGHIYHRDVHIASENVTIGEAQIGRGTVIGYPGARIIYPADGSEPFHVTHVGGVEICDGVRIGVNSVIVKSVWPRRTYIGKNVFIGNLVNVGHNAQVNDGAVILPEAVLGGSCTIGEGATIGLGAIIRPHVKVGTRAYVSMGSVVTKDVPDDERVTGNFAMDHGRFIENIKRWSA